MHRLSPKVYVLMTSFQEQGPKLQNSIFDALQARFRKYNVVLACDIQEMYLRVGIVLPDRKYQWLM